MAVVSFLFFSLKKIKLNSARIKKLLYGFLKNYNNVVDFRERFIGFSIDVINIKQENLNEKCVIFWDFLQLRWDIDDLATQQTKWFCKG